MQLSFRLFIAVAVLLLASVAWHAFDYEHGHTTAFGESNEFHFVLSAEMFLLAVILAAADLERLLAAAFLFRPALQNYRERDPTAAFLASGILHPKIYAA
jgi:hypothetical protein